MITDEMVELAIAAGTPEVSATRDYIYQEFDMRAALAAVLPLIRNAALEEAARLCDKRGGARPDDVERYRTHADRREAFRCAAAIRALKETPND